MQSRCITRRILVHSPPGARGRLVTLLAAGHPCGHTTRRRYIGAGVSAGNYVPAPCAVTHNGNISVPSFTKRKETLGRFGQDQGSI